ncbi:hypothetical protein ACXWTF_07655 [Thiomicrolovo sp. ZZH C-3]
MNKINLENCNQLKFLHKDRTYTVKGCSEVKSFAFDLSAQEYNIYDDYGAPLKRRMETLLDEIKNDGIHAGIQESLLKNYPECFILPCNVEDEKT